MTQVSEVMTRDVRTRAPTETLLQAARTMDELDVGVIPMVDRDRRLMGIVAMADRASAAG